MVSCLSTTLPLVHNFNTLKREIEWVKLGMPLGKTTISVSSQQQFMISYSHVCWSILKPGIMVLYWQGSTLSSTSYEEPSTRGSVLGWWRTECHCEHTRSIYLLLLLPSLLLPSLLPQATQVTLHSTLPVQVGDWEGLAELGQDHQQQQGQQEGQAAGEHQQQVIFLGGRISGRKKKLL